MAGISPSVGLITGVPIQDTINKLMVLAAGPRDALTARNQSALAEQTALGKIQGLVLTLKASIQKLTKTATFDKQVAKSSQESLIAATVTGSSTNGQYSFTPVRRSQTQQLLSNGFASNSQSLAGATFSFRFGGFVDAGLALDMLNGGNGVRAGKIQITDRSGATAEIDLRFAQDVNDVLDAINTAQGIQVTAVADGDRLKLIDQSGSTAANLRVREVGNGTTAADLGLGGIDVAANEASGQDVLGLFGSLGLDRLNHGTGIRIRSGLPDLEVSFRDGSGPLQIDFDTEGTLDELLATLNAADPSRLQAQLSPDGDRLQLIDLTAGGGTFAVTSPLGGNLAADLGLTGAAVGGVLTGDRLLGGLRTSLLRSLAGGAGLGNLGLIAITNRAGVTTNVNLAGAETLDEVLNAINASSAGVSARYNDARNGLQLTDNTGSTLQNLAVANGDGTNSADRLQLAQSSATGRINSGSLRLQVLSENTRLDALNGGQGIFRNTIILTDTAGQAGSIRLLDSQYETLGDVIAGINGLGIGIQARINDAGDGLALIDTAGGPGLLNVRDNGSGRAALELGIRGNGVVQMVGGASQLAIVGSTTQTITLDNDDTLQDLVTKINGANAGVVANLLNLGGGSQPYRVTLTSQRPGKAGELLVDFSQTPLAFSEMSRAQDALLAIGATETSPGLLISSREDRFDQIVPGLSLTLNGTSTSPVTVSVENTNSEVLDNVKRFVTDYNKLVEALGELTNRNTVTGVNGVLFGSTEALRIESDFGRLLSGRIYGAGSITTLEAVGISLDQQGKLSLNEQKFKDLFQADQQALEDFFTKADLGLAVRLERLIEGLAGTPVVNGKPQGSSLLDARSAALQQRIDFNKARIDQMTRGLDAQRLLLEKQFAQMESAVARLQGLLSEISRIQPMVYTPSNG